MADTFRSGDALFAHDAEMRIVLWNAEAERLTGIPADEAVGRPCWDVLHGVDERGAVLCHAGCSAARLARTGWPVPCSRMVIRTAAGPVLVSSSTVAVRSAGAEPIVLQLLRRERPFRDMDRRPEVVLTPRQLEVLRLLADGVPAKVIATRLGIAEATARNHIQAILARLGCHSQLEAVARATRLGVL